MRKRKKATSFLYISLPIKSSNLGKQQVPDHLAAGDGDGAVEGGEVEGAEEAVGEAEEQHGGDPAAGVLEGKAALGHLVLLDGAAAEVVDAARGEDLGLVVARRVGPLLPRQDVEVVVRGVAARVALGADRRPEDDQVLRDACYALGIVS